MRHYLLGAMVFGVVLVLTSPIYVFAQSFNNNDALFIADGCQQGFQLIEGKCLQVRTQGSLCNPDTNLFENPGFETPSVARTGWDIIPFTDPALKWLGQVFPGVDIPTGRIGLELQAGVGGAPHGGSQLAELDGDHPTQIYQDIPTILGKEYSLSYYFSPRPNTPATENQLEVKVGDVVVGAHTAEGVAQTSWTQYATTFTATSSITRVSFRDVGPDDNGSTDGLGSFLDDVSLRCVGDPVLPQESVPPPASNGGGSGTYDYWGCTNSTATNFNNLANKDDGSCMLPPTGEVLGASTTADPAPRQDTLAEVCELHKYEVIKYGADNSIRSVTELQGFLNRVLHLRIFSSGIYNMQTRNAVRVLQSLHVHELLIPWATESDAVHDLKYFLLLTKCGDLNYSTLSQ